MKTIDLTGKRFGRLTVVEFAFKKNKRKYWLCKCDCGNYKAIQSPHLTSGHTQSCGCLHKEKAKQLLTKHGKYYSRLYSIWVDIKDRCCNPKNQAYKNYGGRGINIWSEWLDKENGFMNFYNWAMANGYNDGLTIERIDNDGNYSTDNCRWATVKEQANNRRSNVLVTHNGKTQTMKEWAHDVGIPYKAVWARMQKLGWSSERALTEPVKKGKRK